MNRIFQTLCLIVLLTGTTLLLNACIYGDGTRGWGGGEHSHWDRR